MLEWYALIVDLLYPWKDVEHREVEQMSNCIVDAAYIIYEHCPDINFCWYQIAICYHQNQTCQQANSLWIIIPTHDT